MRHFLVNIFLTLPSTLGLGLSSISQDHIRALDTSARSDEPSSVFNTPLQRRMCLDTIGTSSCTSGQAVVTSSSRQILRPYPLPGDITTSTSLTNSSLESNGGYRAAAYYVNWVSYTKTTMLTSLKLLGNIWSKLPAIRSSRWESHPRLLCVRKHQLERW